MHAARAHKRGDGESTELELEWTRNSSIEAWPPLPSAKPLASNSSHRGAQVGFSLVSNCALVFNEDISLVSKILSPCNITRCAGERRERRERRQRRERRERQAKQGKRTYESIEAMQKGSHGRSGTKATSGAPSRHTNQRWRRR